MAMAPRMLFLLWTSLWHFGDVGIVLVLRAALTFSSLNSASSPMPEASWELQKQWDVRLESQKTYRVNTEKDMSILHCISARLTCPFQCWLCRSFETQVSHLIVSVVLNLPLAWASWQSWVDEVLKATWKVVTIISSRWHKDLSLIRDQGTAGKQAQT